MKKNQQEVDEKDLKETKSAQQPEKDEVTEDEAQPIQKNIEEVDAELKKLEELVAGKNVEIESLRHELDEKKDHLLRKVAEFENMRKRVARERVQLYENAKIDALREFLPINDDLQRTLQAAEANEVDETFLEGVKMVVSKFADVLDKYGVEAINEINIPFDVELHDALMKQKPPTDDVESNTVIQILEPGYKLKEKVIRHAKVIVSE